MIYFCCDERRRAMVRDHAPVNGVDYNGIDFLEIDTEADTQSARQHRLRLHFLKTTSLDQITVNNVLIEGGERIRGIVVKKVEVGAGPSSKILTIDVDNPSDASGQTIAGVGDYSIYTLRLVTDAKHAGGSDGGGQTPAGFDSVLSAVQFSFKIECPSDFDCAPERLCPPAPRTEPEIDYLAKDYHSFRQLMLDRLSVLMPQWTERNSADEGIALVELLAYVGDHLSYQQDVIATEAYLDTARRRISVRRHALLVDYFMHDGCNARAWIHLQAGSDNVFVKQGTRLITHVDGVKAVLNPDTDIEALRQVEAVSTQSFETMHDVVLFTAHNEIKFYTGGDEHCCLPAGSTQATLDGDLPDLKPGDVLVFEEIAGAVNGVAADANPSHRHAVRLTKVDREIQEGAGVQLPLTDPMAADPNQRCTQIEWHVDDALPFALCISAPVDTEYRNRISVARGNIVLADHGLTLTEDIGAPALPDEDLATVASSNTSCCEHTDASPALPPFRPRLDKQPLTQVAPFNPKGQSQIPANRDPSLSASAAFRWEMRDVLPAIILRDSDGRTWRPRRDLLSSDAFKEEFVAEIEEDGRATLRFGDDQHGLQPAPQVEFAATYRTGNGAGGNLGADSLVHVVTIDAGVVGVRNPLAARGGTDPESIEHVRRVAPDSFRIQERAVTPEDYAEVARRHREVQDAAATVRWTGSWRTIFLTIDRLGGRPVDADFEADLRVHLERYRMAGHDVEIDGPQFVPLEIEMTVCVMPNYFRSDVKEALLKIFSKGTLPDGERGFFHPDNFSFGQPVYLSTIYAAAQKVEGVRFVTVETFRRLGSQNNRALDDGVLTLDRLEVARLDNDPSFAERGVFRLTMEGGK